MKNGSLFKKNKLLLDHVRKASIRLIALAVLLVFAQDSLATKWDNPNLFVPEEGSSMDIANAMIVCVADLYKKKQYEDDPEEGLKYCGCIVDLMRDSESLEVFFNSDIAEIKSICSSEKSRDERMRASSQKFLNSEQIFKQSFRCGKRLEVERPAVSQRYRSIACGCILDAARKEKTLTPRTDDVKLCHEYADKQTKN